MPPRKPLTRPVEAARRALVARDTIAIPVAIRRYRVLFSDGVTKDFLSYSDHSGIRGEMLDLHFGKQPTNKREAGANRIEGIADLGVVYTHIPELPEPLPQNAPDSNPS